MPPAPNGPARARDLHARGTPPTSAGGAAKRCCLPHLRAERFGPWPPCKSRAWSEVDGGCSAAGHGGDPVADARNLARVRFV
eukprot:6341788-Pyramimonas_sp.AAC.1